MSEITHTTLPVSKIVSNTGQIDGVPRNPRKWTKEAIESLARSLEASPKLFEGRGLLVVPHGDKFVTLGGNMRLAAARHLKKKEVPVCIYPEDTTVEEMRDIVMKDNGSFGEFDEAAIKEEWYDYDFKDTGVEIVEAPLVETETEEETIARKKREFEERIAAGEMSEEDEEYQEFLDKFKLKKTTDDCYTPDVVYEAVADWVAKEYGVSRARFVRPFYPGGDYQRLTYSKDAIVVDNPPFSILAEILQFYHRNGVKFFLFAPSLTLFSSSSQYATALPCDVTITYANKANVNTSFLTNLEPKEIRLRSAPTLYKAAKEANDKNRESMRDELPKYDYPDHIITSKQVGTFSRLGIDFSVTVAESESVACLDAQREFGKAIYGRGYLVGDKVVEAKRKAEKLKPEREAERDRERAERDRERAERWELSPREIAIVKSLTPKN